MPFLKPLYSSLALIFICLGLSGCASLFSGTQQEVRVKTHADAEIFINGRYAGTGYTVKKLDRDASHEIKVVHAQCEQSLNTQPRFNKISLLGLMMDLGIMSIPTDFFTGAAWNIYPNKLNMIPKCDDKAEG